MDADTDVDLFGRLFVCIVGAKSSLNLLSALHGLDHGGKLHEEAIPGGLSEVTVVLTYGLLDELVVELQQPQHASFVAAHLATKADDVGEHDGGEFAGLGRRLCLAL